MPKDLNETPSKSFDQLVSEINQSPSKRIDVPLKELLVMFEAERRGKHVIEQINSAIKSKDLASSPPIDRADYYGSVTIAKLSDDESSASIDPFPRLKDIPLTKIVSVQKEQSLSTAITLMIANDYSQLPIICSKGRRVDGLISWRSIGNALNLRADAVTTVSQARENVDVLDDDVLLSKAIEQVINDECILVRGKDGVIKGIVTQFDVGQKYLELSNGFLTLKDIESFLRSIIERHISHAELQQVRPVGNDVVAPEDEITSIDLYFSEYIKIFSNAEYWKRFGIKIDQSVFCQILGELIEVRNAVMHFRAGKDEIKNLDSLRKMKNLIHSMDSHSD